MISAVVFDLDGTIYIGDTLTAYAKEAVHEIQGMGLKTLFLTNNSVRTRKDLQQKLSSLGLTVDVSNVYSSAYSAARFLREKSLNDVFVVGSTGLCDEIRSAGINMVSEDDCSVLVVGLDLGFSYEVVSRALVAVRNGARIVACNTDSSYPAGLNKILPGCGAMVGAIERASGKGIDYIVGKPNTYLLEMICADWRLGREDILVVGDDPESDIEMANRFGCPSILVDNAGLTLKEVLGIIKERKYERN